MTETERTRLIEAAVQGIAWALIDGETDVADRGVSEEHYRESVAEARALLPQLVAQSPVPENSPEGEQK